MESGLYVATPYSGAMVGVCMYVCMYCTGNFGALHTMLCVSSLNMHVIHRNSKTTSYSALFVTKCFMQAWQASYPMPGIIFIRHIADSKD